MIKQIWDSLTGYFHATALYNEAEAMIARESFAEAEPLLREAVDIMGEDLNVFGGKCMSSLGFCLLKLGQEQEAEGYLCKGAWMSDHGVPENMRYANFLMDHGRYEEATESLLRVWLNDTNAGLKAHDEVQKKYNICLKNAGPGTAPLPGYLAA